MEHHDIAIHFFSNTVNLDSPKFQRDCTLSQLPTTAKGIPPPIIHMIGAAAFLQANMKPGTTCVDLSLYEIKNVLGETKQKAHWKEKVPTRFHGFLQMFDEELSKGLPSRRPTQEELKALKEYIEENLTKGFIQASSSPPGAPVVSVKKSDGSL
jgi:hypothetical protein